MLLAVLALFAPFALLDSLALLVLPALVSAVGRGRKPVQSESCNQTWGRRAGDRGYFELQTRLLTSTNGYLNNSGMLKRETTNT